MDPTWHPDRPHRSVHVLTEVGSPERVLSPEELATASSYVTYHYEGDRLTKVEHVRDKRLQSVNYLGQPWPDDGLLARHRRDYGAVPFDVLTPSVAGPEGARRRLYRIDAAGAVAEYVEHELDGRGEVLTETRYLPDGRFLERTEYVYDEDGELTLTREIDADGTVQNEWESPQ